jgi:AcrR family transcriptional regulator
VTATVRRLGRIEQGEQTRGRILDAAEFLFAERGFHGVSLRDITTRAGVENALASYHFRTKELLFTSVVERRATEHRRDLLESLAHARAATGPGPPGNEALVCAYARPALEKIGRGAGWAAYIKLIVGIQNLDRADPASTMTNSLYDESICMFVAAFEAANPGLPRRSVLFAIYFLHGALIHILSQGRTFDRLVDDGRGFRDTEETLRELAAFFAHGLDPVGRAKVRKEAVLF